MKQNKHIKQLNNVKNRINTKFMCRICLPNIDLMFPAHNQLTIRLLYGIDPPIQCYNLGMVLSGLLKYKNYITPRFQAK